TGYSWIALPQDSFDGDYYVASNGAHVPFSLERLLAHEFFHAWWDVMDGVSGGDSPYDNGTPGDPSDDDTSQDNPHEEQAGLDLENDTIDEMRAGRGLPPEEHRPTHDGIEGQDTPYNILDPGVNFYHVLHPVVETGWFLFHEAFGDISPLVLDLDGDGIEVS